ncbi:MAG TPA: hypothetical protein VFX30_07875 [bacterium]|nr:hypothetical protein [bacterium]
MGSNTVDLSAVLQSGVNYSESEGTVLTAEAGVAPSADIERGKTSLTLSGLFSGGVTYGDWRASFSPMLSVGLFRKVGIGLGPRFSYNFGTDSAEAGATAWLGTLIVAGGEGLPTGLVVSLNDFANRDDDRMTVSFMIAAPL